MSERSQVTHPHPPEPRLPDPGRTPQPHDASRYGVLYHLLTLVAIAGFALTVVMFFIILTTWFTG